ncbi:MAG: HDOD domain-containing protein, partial [Methanothrix sp.]|nr:HDOD domain-containing protein [Methanothrix sp.]
VVLDQYIADLQPLFYRMIIEQKEDSSLLERKIIGIDHCHSGLMLADTWNLPDILKDVILFHHAPFSNESNIELVNLVYLADVFTTKFLTGLELEQVGGGNIQRSLDILSMNVQTVYDNLSVIADFS